MRCSGEGSGAPGLNRGLPPGRSALVILIALLAAALAVAAMLLLNPLALHPELRSVGKPALKLEELPKLVLAFYYPWYGTPDGPTGHWRHWDEGGHNPDVIIDGRRDIGAAHYPVGGPYDSKDRRVIARHLEMAEEAGVDGFIVSWWGFGSFEDEVFRLMLDVAEELNTSVKLTVYYEVASGGRDEVAGEIERILREYGGRRAFLRVQGYPVIFIYSRALRQLGRGWGYVVRKVRHGGFEAVFVADSFDEQAAEVFDGIHTYNPVGVLSAGGDLKSVYAEARALASRRGVVFAATVLPGYDDTRIRKPGLAYPRREGRTYRETWEAARESRADWVLICSWNEWHEGSEVEPSLEHGDLYLRITAEEAGRFKGSPG